MPDLPVPVISESETKDWKTLVPPALMILGGLSLLRTSRVLSLALVGAWLADVACSSDAKRTRMPRAKAKREEMVDEALDESFPASDPPAYSGGHKTTH